MSYKGVLNYNGNETLTVVSTDSAGTPLSDADLVEITVGAVNDAPVAVADRIIVSNSTAVTISASTLLDNDTDIDGAALVITEVSAPSGITGLTFNAATGMISFTSGTCQAVISNA